MATALENAQTRYDAIMAELARMDADKAGGKPNAPGNADHVGYRKSLLEEAAMLEQRIVWLSGDAEVESYGIV